MAIFKNQLLNCKQCSIENEWIFQLFGNVKTNKSLKSPLTVGLNFLLKYLFQSVIIDLRGLNCTVESVSVEAV